MDKFQQQHEMVLEKTHPTGAEQWYCPTCGRRFLMRWPPEYKLVVLQPGDQYAQHSGSKGGLKMGSPEVTKIEQQEPSEESLHPWLEILEEIDLEW